MSSTESLELVSRVLGVANWQTLQALAISGTGPRVDEAATRINDGSTGPGRDVSSSESILERLAAYFGTETAWGEHPDYPRADWKYLVENGDDGGSYWHYVFSQIEMNNAMLPWERDSNFAVLLSKSAGMTVSRSEDEDGWELSDPHGLSFSSTQDSELEMWRAASDDVQKHLIHVFSLSQEVFDKMSEAAWLTAAVSCLAVEQATSELELGELEGNAGYPGEMSKDERKFSAAVPFVRAIGMEPTYTEEKADVGVRWTSGFRFYVTEADAWNESMQNVRDEVLSSTQMFLNEWERLDFASQVTLAKTCSNLAKIFRPA